MPIAGRWEGDAGARRLILRVDAGEPGRLGVVSGDLLDAGGEVLLAFQTTLLTWRRPAGGGVELAAPLTLHRAELYGELAARFWPARPGRPESAGTVTLVWASHRRAADGGSLEVSVRYIGQAFRSARLRVDRTLDPERGVPYEAGGAYRLGSASPSPPGLPRRDLDVAGAFADAGVELKVEQGAAPIALPPSAAKLGLTDDELHAILAATNPDAPDRGWWLHLLLAPRYAIPGVLGVMYDSDLLHPRHGAVVFMAELAATVPPGTPEHARELLYTQVHELGHAFNLLHSFHKGRPESLSWMNYPHLWPHGRAVDWQQADRFWAEFRYRFDRDELVHVRHHEHAEVVMGGEPFGAIGHLGPLRAELDAPATAEFGEPVPLALILHNRGRAPIELASPLDAQDALDLWITTPSGKTDRFRPLCVRRAAARPTLLAPGASRRLPLRAFYGRDGFAFAAPGTYRLSGTLELPGWAPLRVATTPLAVRPPSPRLERLIEEHIFGDEQGHFLTFFGGDHLARGRAALEELAQDPRLAHTRTQARVRTALAASCARRWQGAPGAAARPARLNNAARWAHVADTRPGVILDALVRALRMADAPESVLLRAEAEAAS